MRDIVSFSGGKDSTAMLLMMVECGENVDEIVFFDTGWEFPQMLEHVDKVEEYIGIPITRLYPEIPFTELMLHNHRTRGKRIHLESGYGWPTARARWCTTMKSRQIRAYIGRDAIQHIGIAADESRRVKDGPKIDYPLVRYGVTESEALSYCNSRGFDWGGLYENFDRVSCYCCPLQRLDDLRAIRARFPELWRHMLELDEIVRTGDFVQRNFRRDCSLFDLDARFHDEENPSR